MVGKVVEITFILVALFLVITNAEQFSKATAAVGNLYLGAVTTLQGKAAPTLQG